MRKLITATLVASVMATSAFAETKEHTATDCVADTVVGTTVGTLVGGTIGAASSILLAPLTGGGSLLALPTFIGVGLKGGLIWGAAGGVGTCVYKEVTQ